MDTFFILQEEQEDTTVTFHYFKPSAINQLSIICHICRQFICAATETSCNHVFCQDCINEYFLFIEDCPKCEATVRHHGLFSNKLIDTLVQEYIKMMQDQRLLLDFEYRMELYNKRKRQIRVERFERSMEVDVRDECHIWRVGRVMNIYTDHFNEAKSATFRYAKSKETDNIDLPSTRIASKGSYTSRKQIPHYAFGKKVIVEHNGSIKHLTDWRKRSRA